MRIDIAMPTKESANVIGETLDHAAAAVDSAGATVNQLIIVDDESEDRTTDIAREKANAHAWDATIVSEPATLPQARERAIGLVETEWFWFLDDDVRVDETYLEFAMDTIAPAVGGVQGRKASRTEGPSDWVRRRSRRAGTHASLIRKAAVTDVSIPADVTVLEDEYLRRWAESKGYLWSFQHQARFDHECQDRHPIGWTEGAIAGKYGFAPFHQVALNVPFSLATGRNPIPHAKRAAGWVAGYLNKHDLSNYMSEHRDEIEADPHV